MIVPLSGLWRWSPDPRPGPSVRPCHGLVSALFTAAEPGPSLRRPWHGRLSSSPQKDRDAGAASQG
jgi:hypothetical protein